jgi:hypothetical protein
MLRLPELNAGYSIYTAEVREWIIEAKIAMIFCITAIKADQVLWRLYEGLAPKPLSPHPCLW